MRIDNQMTLGDINPEYQAFVDKFKPKKTTDDCYTPPLVFEAVLDWVVDEYGIDREKVVRPFWPGGDYLRFDYPDDCVVVDNPPFSIISQICRDYVAAGVRFFLFAPYLTCLNILPEQIGHVITATDIEYENGAKIGTSFVTNLEPCLARSAPDLRERIAEAVATIRREKARTLPKYKYPDNVVTAAMLGYMANHDTEYTVRRGRFIRELDSQRESGKAIFGGGYLISDTSAAEKAAAEKAAAEKAAAECWQLSDRERLIIESLEET